MLNRPLRTKVALSAIEQAAPNSHAWLSHYIAELERQLFNVTTGLKLAAADEAERTGKLETKYDSYLLPMNTDVTEMEVTPL